MAVQLFADSQGGTVQVRLTISDSIHLGIVSVVGTFNDWLPGVDTFRLNNDGTRTAVITVPAGADLHFRYLASGGLWFDEADADEVTPQGSILHLAAPPDDQPAQSTPPIAPSPKHRGRGLLVVKHAADLSGARR